MRFGQKRCHFGGEGKGGVESEEVNAARKKGQKGSHKLHL